MIRARAAAAVGVAALIGVSTAGAAAADQTSDRAPGLQVAAATGQPMCVPDDDGLAELSGLVAGDGVFYAVGDSGSDHRVAELGPDCRVRRWIDVPVQTVDVEDLALGPDGRLWLADIGDNRADRQTVALIGLALDGSGAVVHELVYPDGAHDAEALLLGVDGDPVIVVKQPLGPAGVYAPEPRFRVTDRPGGRPVQLSRVGTVDLPVTDTPGGPVPPFNTPAVTGGAVDRAGAVVALRTYTDAYLYRAEGTDPATALTGPALRIPLPARPQGEAITITADGAVVVGSESAGGDLPPLDRVPGAVAELRDRSPAPTSGDQTPVAEAAESARSTSWKPAIVAAAAVAVAAVAAGAVLLSRRR